MRKYLQRILLVTLFVGVMFFYFTVFACAENVKSDELYTEDMQDLFDGLNDDVRDALASIGIESLSSEELTEISFGNVFQLLFGFLKRGAKAPLSCMGTLFCLLVLNAVAGSCILPKDGLRDYFETVGVLFASLLLFSQVISCVTSSAAALTAVVSFTKLLVPIMAAIAAFLGNPTMAVSYQAGTLYSAEIISSVCCDFLVPILCIFSAAAVCAAANRVVRINSILSMVKTLFHTVLGLAGTVFTGILALKNILAVNIDRVSFKGIQFVLGSAVPVVGSTLSEGLSSLIAAAGLMKSTYGIIGILVIVITVLPSVCELLIWLLGLTAIGYAAQALDQNSTASVIESLRFVLSMMLSLILFAVYLLIVSTGMIILMHAK